MTKPRNSGSTTRGRPFVPGNPGRPPGSRHKATLAAEVLLDGEAEKLTRKAVDMALAGDPTALRLCLERIVPPRKDRPLLFAMPPIAAASDHPAALAAVLTAVATGELTPAEAQAFAAIMAEHRKAIEVADIEARLSALEGATPR